MRHGDLLPGRCHVAHGVVDARHHAPSSPVGCPGDAAARDGAGARAAQHLPRGCGPRGLRRPRGPPGRGRRLAPVLGVRPQNVYRAAAYGQAAAAAWNRLLTTCCTWQPLRRRSPRPASERGYLCHPADTGPGSNTSRGRARELCARHRIRWRSWSICLVRSPRFRAPACLPLWGCPGSSGGQGLRYHGRYSSFRDRASSRAWRSVSGACAPDTAMRRLKIKHGTLLMPACRASRSARNTSSRPPSDAR
jgi:hypothetical protein